MADVSQQSLRVPMAIDRIVVLPFLALLAFALPWSSEFARGFGAVFSHLFNVALMGLILDWVFRSRRRWHAMPRAYAAMVVFVLAHNFITWVVIHPGELSWQPIVVDLGVKTSIRDSSASLLVKNLLFMLLPFALATQIRGAREIRAMTWALGASLLALVTLGDAGGVLAGGERFSGGMSNPNAFAEVTVILAWLALASLMDRSRTPAVSVAAAIALVFAFVLLLMSGSRGAIVAVAAGLGVFALSSLRVVRPRYVVMAVVIGAGVLLATPRGVFDQLFQRSQTVSGDNVRLFIWADYLRHWREFAWTGVGLGREMSVIDAAIRGGRIWNPHNTYLGALVAFGIVGLAVVANVLVDLARRLLAECRRSRSEGAPGIMVGLVVSLAVLFFFGDRLESRVTWMMLGIVGAHLENRGGAA